MLPRFYLSTINSNNDQIDITEQKIIHQITDVLRLKKNDIFVVFSPQAEYEVVLKNITKDKITTTILEKRISNREPERQLTLYQSLLKKDKFEWVLQKGVELGVHTFIPIVTDNCVVREISKNKFDRYHKIIAEATEQCGGQRVAELAHPVAFAKALEQLKGAAGQKLLAWEGQSGDLLTKKIENNADAYHLLIGPEGGFSPKEIELAEQNGISLVSLGKRILRAETAAIAAISLIMI